MVKLDNTRFSDAYSSKISPNSNKVDIQLPGTWSLSYIDMVICALTILYISWIEFVNVMSCFADEDEVSVIFVDEQLEDRTDKEIHNFVSLDFILCTFIAHC